MRGLNDGGCRACGIFGLSEGRTNDTGIVRAAHKKETDAGILSRVGLYLCSVLPVRGSGGDHENHDENDSQGPGDGVEPA